MSDIVYYFTDDLSSVATWFGRTPKGNWDKAVVGCRKTPPYSHWCLAVEGEVLAGGVCVIVRKGKGVVTNHFVFKAHRRRGIGLALLKGILEYARAIGVKRVVAYATIMSVGFYRAMGFVLGSSRSGVHGNGEAYTTTHVSKMLN